MAGETALDARRFVEDLDLEGVPRHAPRYLGAPPPRFVPQEGAEQAVVVGSHLQTFTGGVSADARLTLEDAMLLAQLRAKKLAHEDAEGWYREYFDVLTRIGLVVEERNFVSTDTALVQADVEKVVLELAASLLGGPATTAFKIVAATLQALEQLDESSPAVTIFRRETHRQAGRFQVSAVEQDDRGLGVALMAFTLDASTSTTQVLFFKKKAEEARLRHLSSRLVVNQRALEAVAAQIAAKVVDYTDGYVRQLEI